jgi:hypothetical protein
MPDLTGDMAFEAADRLQLGLAFGLLAFEIGAGRGVELGPAERDDVDRAVQLPVTAAMQAVTTRLAGARWDRRRSGTSGEARLAAKPLRASGPADDDRRGHRPHAELLQQLWRVGLEQRGQLGEQIALLA